MYDSAKLLQHYSTILNTTLLCDVEKGGQTNSILLITPENIEKVDSILQNIIAQGGTPENKKKSRQNCETSLSWKAKLVFKIQQR